MSKDLTLRFATHLGYMPPDDEPLFAASVGTPDVRAQVQYAKDIGLAGVFHPWVLHRSDEERTAFKEALVDTALECGCLVMAPWDVALAPNWVLEPQVAQTILAPLLDRCAPLAVELGATHLVALIRSDEALDHAGQWEHALTNMRWAADRIAVHGIKMSIEPMNALPDMLLSTLDDTIRFFEQVDHPSVKLIFDTGHFEMMCGDIRDAWRRTHAFVGPIQVADMPARNEPGAGELDLTGFFTDMIADGFGNSLLELEFDWADPSEAGEQAGMDRIRRVDLAVAEALDAQR